MKYRAPKGTHDLLPEDAYRWRFVERTFRRACAEFGYREIRTPMFENTELFVRAVGEHTDIVSKEMYTVSARRGARDDDSSFTLRPEGTAPALRAFIEHSLGARGGLTKLFYIAPNFRHEQPQSGRLRQHHQTGIEALGSEDPALDAEVIALGLTYLRRVGITGEQTEVNTVGCSACRPAYREALREALADRIETMCGNCKVRYESNPLRILDCKVEDWSVLEPLIPDILDHVCESCREHFGRVLAALEALDVTFVRNKRLVRGLDYYVKTSFEVTHGGLGAQSTILGGGRYDGLVEELGGNPTPGIGFGCGIERVLLTAQALGMEFPNDEPRPAFIVAMTPEARLPAIRMAHRLRQAGLSADLDYLGRAWRKQMREATRLNARAMLILGEGELADGTVVVKDMDSGEQRSVADADLVDAVRPLLSGD